MRNFSLPLSQHVEMAAIQKTESSREKMSDGKEEFRTVKSRSRKRKLTEGDGGTKAEKMETTATVSKRPYFPPISSDKLTVC